jgi:glycosyltransferase involved in cell wall biosynthesis
MRIAQVAPLFESVPPAGYGGTERVISYLTEELVRQGHEVTLFCSADSHTAARMVPCAPKALRSHLAAGDPLGFHLVEIEHVAQREAEFDVIHSHLDHLPYSIARRSSRPWVTTLHGRLDLEHLVHVYREFSDQHVVAISHSQRRHLPWLRWADTVHHGLPRDLYPFRAAGSQDLVFMGRISPEKRVDRAVEIAVRTGRRLRIAAKVDAADREHYRMIRHVLEHPSVEFVGEIGDSQKAEFLGNAAALLFPIDWPEPFGMVMIEALACGTPVIAWRHGSVEEVLTDGVTGYVCDDVAEGVRAVERLERLDRSRCRLEFESRFSAERMAERYVAIYQRLIDESRAAA